MVNRAKALSVFYCILDSYAMSLAGRKEIDNKFRSIVSRQARFV